MIRREDVPLISSVAATLLSGLIGSMTDVDISVTDAVNVAVCIVNKAQTKVSVNGRRRFIPEERQRAESSEFNQNAH